MDQVEGIFEESMTKAIVCMNGNVVFNGEIKSWTQMTNGLIKVITAKDHTMYLSHSSNILICEEWV